MPQKSFTVSGIFRWLGGIAMAGSIVVIPFLYHRHLYSSIKRLRVVEPGKFYRSGRATGPGLERTLQRYKIKTVINLMNEEQEPQLAKGFFDPRTISQREICERNDVKMVYLFVDLISRYKVGQERPKAIAEFLKIMDDPKNHPVLLHCRAGLHRTGILSAIYRMEYNKWSRELAWKELRAHGFGEHNCYADNDYITQYICQYVPRSHPDHSQVAQRKPDSNDPKTKISRARAKSNPPPTLSQKGSRSRPVLADWRNIDWTNFFEGDPRSDR
ncbi:MAG: tyrosine-protein phosphatase [Gemmataceae bacterium]